MVLATPTGSGKSLVAVAALFEALAKAKANGKAKAYYTSPTKVGRVNNVFTMVYHAFKNCLRTV